MNLEPIKRLVKERLGLQFAGHTEDSLRQALEKRCADTNAVSILAYLQRLQWDETEWHALTSLLTINETYFYRESQHLRLLTDALTANRLARVNPGKPVRILSMGCSTGEEPYSIAMALRERYGESAEHLFEITGADVDRQALDKAKAGIYGPYSFRALPAELAARYFTPVDAQHRQIDPAIRRQVSLSHFNLLADAYPRDWAGQDIVFFRNVSIYFDAPTRRAIHQRLQTLLNPEGYLIVGSTETLSNDFGLLTLQERDEVFFFVNRQADQTRAGSLPPWDALPRAENGWSKAGETGQQSRTMLPDSDLPQRSGKEHDGIASPHPNLPPLEGLDQNQRSYQNALSLAREHRFDEALRLLTPLCAEEIARSHYWTLQGHLLLERRDAAGATAAVARALALDAWSVDALLLRGRIARFQGNQEDAIRDFRYVVYSSPDCWPAHYHLGELYRDSGKTGLAIREYRIVLRQLADRDQAIRAAGSVPLAISIEDLRFLCEAQLSRLGQSTD